MSSKIGNIISNNKKVLYFTGLASVLYIGYKVYKSYLDEDSSNEFEKLN
jgi:hypothetical protein